MVSLLDPAPPLDPVAESWVFLRDSTLGVVVPSVFGGYVMGAGMSLFGSMISVETAAQHMGTGDFFKYTLNNAHKLGRNFAFFGVVFGAMDHALEKRRGRKDMLNPVLSGGFIGGFYGWRSIRRPGLVGGFVGGALFSVAIEVIMDKVGMSQK